MVAIAVEVEAEVEVEVTAEKEEGEEVEAGDTLYNLVDNFIKLPISFRSYSRSRSPSYSYSSSSSTSIQSTHKKPHKEVKISETKIIIEDT